MGRTLPATERRRNQSFRGVRFHLLDAELVAAGIVGAQRDLIVGIARQAGSKWTPIRFADFGEFVGVRSHRTLSLVIPPSLRDKWIERRPDPRGGKSFEYRTAARFHQRRPKAVA